MALAAALVLLTAVVVGALDGRDHVFSYKVLGERMFKGIVPSEARVLEGFMYFPLRTAYDTVEIQIGPKEFVERSGFKLNTGDEVTVIGMPVVMRGRQVVLARELRSMNGMLIVRDQRGLPLWENDRPVLMDPERRIRSSDLCYLRFSHVSGYRGRLPTAI
jgi:hypothetical protein